MINYKIINDSIDFYSKKGFQRVESPWTVTKAIADITKPEWATNFSIKEKDKVLVASAEQGFLYLYNKGFLPKGRFQSVSPCFRDESFDNWHTKYFIKNELIVTDKISLRELLSVVNAAKEFFESIIGKSTILIESMTEKNGHVSYDLTYNNIELGSYGIRQCDFLTWIYGTGVAEPRLSRAKEKYGLSQNTNYERTFW